MFVSIYYKPSLFNAHTMILIVLIFMTVNKLCLNHHHHHTAESVPNRHKPLKRIYIANLKAVYIYNRQTDLFLQIFF